MQGRKTGDIIRGWLGLSHTAGSTNWMAEVSASTASGRGQNAQWSRV